MTLRHVSLVRIYVSVYKIVVFSKSLIYFILCKTELWLFVAFFLRSFFMINLSLKLEAF